MVAGAMGQKQEWELRVLATSPVCFGHNTPEAAVPPTVHTFQIHGGTNFGFWAGANVDGERYLPHITSYDYDAPISGEQSLQAC